VADSTVIVQQVCTIIIFICCFSGIYQERISPTTVVSWGTIGTVLGWVLWDAWVGREETANADIETQDDFYNHDNIPTSPTSKDAGIPSARSTRPSSPDTHLTRQGSTTSTNSFQTVAEQALHPTLSNTSASATTGYPTGTSSFASYSAYLPYGVPSSSQFTPRNQQRLATAKSAVLIYFALLGLSPILKSLTLSTAKDSIWAISFWLMCINVFFFDYGSAVAGGGATFPASLSTNAALMASTVLASRLPSTRHVFSLTLFSIEVFGLFPVFRRYLKYVSWRYHFLLTLALVMGAGGGVALSLSAGGWRSAIVGVVLGNMLTGLAMGICSWWLIGLQRYKNEIHGPWDPARPIIRRKWD